MISLRYPDRYGLHDAADECGVRGATEADKAIATALLKFLLDDDGRALHHQVGRGARVLHATDFGDVSSGYGRNLRSGDICIDCARAPVADVQKRAIDTLLFNTVVQELRFRALGIERGQ